MAKISTALKATLTGGLFYRRKMNKEWWVIIASGPSLKRADCDALRGIGQTIAVNRAVFYAPWSSILYGGDANFWKVYGPKTAWFKGKRITHEEYLSTRQFKGDHRFKRFGGNSGHQALQYAVSQGARRVALIGFDHKHTDGRKHYHEDYPRTVQIDNEPVVSFGNAECTNEWIRIMNQSAEDAQAIGVEIVNLSRETALECFPRMTVEEFTGQCK